MRFQCSPIAAADDRFFVGAGPALQRLRRAFLIDRDALIHVEFVGKAMQHVGCRVLECLGDDGVRQFVFAAIAHDVAPVAASLRDDVVVRVFRMGPCLGTDTARTHHAAFTKHGTEGDACSLVGPFDVAVSEFHSTASTPSSPASLISFACGSSAMSSPP
jgi:hypothetical protein